MKHLIFGAGNLGLDIKQCLDLNTISEVHMVSRSNGYEIGSPKVIEEVLNRIDPDVVWYCIGGGSVEEAKQEHPLANESWRFNLNIPTLLNELVKPHVKLIVFSTDYVADEDRPKSTFVRGKIRSTYAQLKSLMEQKIIYSGRPGTSIIRVGSLYGRHKPERTFPGKILSRFAEGTEVLKFPSNIVVPTPTEWLANMLIGRMEELFYNSNHCPAVEHCAPSGGVSVKDWAKFVLRGYRGDEAFTRSEFYDEERPLFSNLGCSFSDCTMPHWYQLFQTYFTPWEYYKRPESQGASGPQ